MFTNEVFSLLVWKRLINFPLIEKILSLRHTGFSVHSMVSAKTKSEVERVGKYMIRPHMSLGRLSFDEDTGKVSYQYGKT
jgi:hypothetical protein